MKVKGTFSQLQHLNRQQISHDSTGGRNVPSVVNVDILHTVSISVEFTDPSDLGGAKLTIVEQLSTHPYLNIANQNVEFEVSD